jgi:glycosyltransferase involved in cell wall biosynthesis
MRIMILGDPLANTRRWMAGLESLDDVTVENWHFSGTSRARRLLEWARALLSIRRVIDRFDPDILIGYRVTSYGFLAAWSGRRPFVVAAQGITDVWPEGHWTTPLKAILARYALKRAALVHAWGEHMTASLVQHGASRDRLLVLPTGVDTVMFAPPATARDTDRIRLVVTRGLYSEYGHLVILRAVERLVADGVPLELHLAGSGTEEGRIREFVRIHGLEKVVFMHGAVAYRSLPALLQRCHLYLSMPETEGVSASLFEAMASGCYPIISDLPAGRGVIQTGVNGQLVPLGDDAALADAIRRAIADPAMVSTAVQGNREYVVAHADLNRNMQRFRDAYRRLLGEGGTAC